MKGQRAANQMSAPGAGGGRGAFTQLNSFCIASSSQERADSLWLHVQPDELKQHGVRVEAHLHAREAAGSTGAR